MKRLLLGLFCLILLVGFSPSANIYANQENKGPKANNFSMAPAIYTLQIESTACGDITTPGEGIFPYPEDTVVNLVATPGPGQRFVNWTGDTGNLADVNAASTTIKMTNNCSITAHFAFGPPPQNDVFKLNVESTAGGTVTTPGEGDFSYAPDAVVDLVATPDPGYYFLNWTGNWTIYDVPPVADDTAASTTIQMDNNWWVTANFTAHFDLTISSNEGGSVTTPGEGTFDDYNSGTLVNLVATPDLGYHFVSWTGDISTITDPSAASTTIRMANDYHINANFEQDGTYHLKIDTLGNGSVSAPGEGIHLNYAPGTIVNLVATPDAGSNFINWTMVVDAGVPSYMTVNPLTFKMTDNITVIATFSYTLKIESTAGGDVTIPGEGAYDYNSGTVVNLLATPAQGYYFVRWTGDIGTLADVNAASTTIIMNSNRSVTALFVYRFDLIINSTAGGQGTTPGEGIFSDFYDAGTLVDLVATPDPGHHFVRWTGDTSTVANPLAASTTIRMTNDYQISANFAIDTFTITYTSGANGSILGTSPQTVNYGASGSAVRAVPNAGYHFVDWSDGSMANPRTDSNVTANISVTANFGINTFTLTYAAGSNGSITGTSPQVIVYGADGTAVTAVPNTGYHFVNWSDGSMANPRTDANVTADISVTANFAINTFTLTYTAGSNGYITGTSSQTVAFGANGTAVTAVPNAGYHFLNWSDGSTANPRTDANITANISVNANFTINTYTLSYTASANGSITGTTPQTVNYGASGTAVTVVPNVGYHFVDWSDGSTANPRTDTNVTANISVTANFAIGIIDTFTLAYTAEANGSITGTSPQTVASGGDGTAVTAVPNIGYHFVNWSDASTANPRTDTNVTTDISVTANFAINTFTLTYSAGANGSIMGISPQTVNYGASGTAVTAVAAGGYYFANWSDGSTANPRTDTNVTANISVTSNFALIITGVGGGGGGVSINRVTLSGLTSPTSLYIDTRGIIQGDAQIKTSDGKVALNISGGTKLLSKQGSPMSNITAGVSVPSLTPPSGNVLVLAYTFGPAGATFNPGIVITLSYDPAGLAENVKEADLYIAYFDGMSYQSLESKADTAARTVSTVITHFSSYALLGKVTTPANLIPTPAATPAPTSTVTPAASPVVTPTTAATPAPVETQKPSPVPESASPVPTGSIAGINEVTPPTAATYAQPVAASQSANFPSWAIIIVIIAAVAIISVIAVILVRRRSSNAKP